MPSTSNTSSVPGLVQQPSQHVGSQSLLAATIGLMSLGTPTNPRNSSSETQDATALDRFTVSERIAAMNRAAMAVVPPACPSSFSPLCETRASLPKPVAPLPTLPVGDSIESVIRNKNFPETLMEVISSEQYQDIITWLPHGRGFVILNRERFTSAILPRYFDGAKFPSFTRRMKRWDFVRVPRGPEMGAYYHKKFLRDRPELVQEMRYGEEGQFEECKKKKQEKKKQNGEEAAENKRVQQYLSNGVLNAQPNDGPRGLACEDKYFKPKIRSTTPEMDTWHSVIPQEHPMPLPSTLPPRNKPPKSRSVQKKMVIDSMEQQAKNAMEAATIQKDMKRLKDQADSMWSSSFSQRPPRSETPLDIFQGGITESEQEFLLARSTLSRQVAKYLSSPRPIGVAGYMTKGGVSNHQPYLASQMINTQRMIENDHVERIVREAEFVLGRDNRQCHAPTLGSNCIPSRKSTICENRMRNIVAPDIQASPKIQRDAIDAIVDALQSRLKSSLVPSSELLLPRSISSGRMMAEALGGNRPVVMNRKEEADLLARYLVLQGIV